MTNEQRKKLDEAKQLLAELEQEMGASVEGLLAASREFDEGKWAAKVDALPGALSKLAISDKSNIVDLLRQVAEDREPQTALMFASMELGQVMAAKKALEAL